MRQVEAKDSEAPASLGWKGKQSELESLLMDFMRKLL